MLIIVLICIMKEMTNAECTVNIAIGKSGTLCEKSKLTWKLFDTDKQAPQKIFFVKRFCSNQPAFLSVNLGNRFYVHYVVVYTGTARNIGSLRHFVVSLISDEKRYACSHFEKLIEKLRAADGMRVNCRTSNLSVSELQVGLLEQKDFEIAEIEVYSLGSANEKLLFYRGCFSKFKSREVMPFDNFAGCWKRCFDRKFPLFAIKENVECHCGLNYEFNHELRLNKCDIICDGKQKTKRICGGIGTFSVYIVKVQLPYYLGCSKDGWTADLIETDITLARCIKYCYDTTFVWLQKDRCGCLSREPKVEFSSASCKIPCTNDKDAMCGNINRYSIYGTCRREGTRFLPCDKIFQCEEFSDKYGVCVDGCRPGFKGEYCLEIDLKVPQKLQSRSPFYYLMVGLPILFLGFYLYKLINQKRIYALHQSITRNT